MKKNSRWIICLNIIMGTIWLLPLYWSFVTSTKTDQEIYGGITLFPQKFTWANYIELFQRKDGIFFEYLKNSITLTLVTVLVVATVSVLAGFAFSKLEIMGSKLWLGLILFTIMVPVQALMVPLHNTLSSLGLLGTLAGMILIYVTFQTPFCVYMMKSSFDMVPNALREAATLDGAGPMAIFKHIYLPLAMPGAITVMVYSAYNTWNDYVIALTFGGNTMKTFNVGLVDLITNDFSISWGVLTSGSIVGLIPITIFFLIFQKYFVKGLMSGAIK
ncbi:MAG: carbohydrate ABC transporter permease [Anaerolineaceae bacterium]|nr:MAG: carbohydrate ABC transporter permease [Anaerolineaceae bacterium]